MKRCWHTTQQDNIIYEKNKTDKWFREIIILFFSFHINKLFSFSPFRLYLSSIWFRILSVPSRSRWFGYKVLWVMLQRARRRPALPVLFWIEQGPIGCTGYVLQAWNALQQLPRLLWCLPKMSRGRPIWAFGNSEKTFT